MCDSIRANLDAHEIGGEEMLDARDFEYGVVASRPDQMYGWPGLTRVSGGVVLAAASERKYHVDPFGREVVMRGCDRPDTRYHFIGARLLRQGP